MTRTLLGTVAMAVCVALGSGSTASAGGPHNHHHGHHVHQHHQHHHHGGFGYGGYRPRYVAIHSRPVIVAPQPYGSYGPAPCVTDYDYNYGYNGYAPSGVGFSNRNFSLWLGR